MPSTDLSPLQNPSDDGSKMERTVSEDVLAIAIGGLLLAVCFLAVWLQAQSASSGGGSDALTAGPGRAIEEQTADENAASSEGEDEAEEAPEQPPVAGKLTSPLKGWLSKPGTWSTNPIAAVVTADSNRIVGILAVLVIGLIGFGWGAWLRGVPPADFLCGFLGLFLLATLAYGLAGQEVVKHYGLSYALWALAIGLVISNVMGTPGWMRPAIQTEFYIKTGLVILGAEVLFGQLLALGLPGICIAWVVTPVVLISTFWFGQRILKIKSPSLNMVISADMSVCGVSAAIATAAACRARKEELSLAIGLSLTFTVIMMVLMPIVIQAAGISQVIGGAWMGGTIDATGAVAAAGEQVGEKALAVAATVKMIQNVLIGVIAFGVATVWVLYYDDSSVDGASDQRPGVSEIWRRFPKFILGFIAASAAFSLIHAMMPNGPELVEATIKDSTKTLRGWFFCLAFVSIGLDSNFRELSRQLQGGKPLILYVVGQTLNLTLTLLMAWLMFEMVFPGAADVLGP